MTKTTTRNRHRNYLNRMEGRPVYDWGCAMLSKGGEDATHAGMDVAGFASANASGDYCPTAAKTMP
jgi:hypothetical protein